MFSPLYSRNPYILLYYKTIPKYDFVENVNAKPLAEAKTIRNSSTHTIINSSCCYCCYYFISCYNRPF